MLYNDEVYSYEQVVVTLREVLSMEDKKVLEYATVVDKEVRSAIKRGKRLYFEHFEFLIKNRELVEANGWTK